MNETFNFEIALTDAKSTLEAKKKESGKEKEMLNTWFVIVAFLFLALMVLVFMYFKKK